MALSSLNGLSSGIRCRRYNDEEVAAKPVG